MKADDGKGDDAYTPRDLIDLVRAIKFAHPEMSMKNVHKEISGTMANSADSYSFLKDVKLDEVKKVWKKALKSPSSESNNANKSMQKTSADDQPKIPADGIMKFYTVGDGSVKALAENYSKQHAQAVIAAIQLEKKEELAKYTHFFLDVPADLSGSRPHQALISFNDNNNKQKKNSGSNKKTSTTSSYDGNSDGRKIFKIQAAQLPPGMEDVLTPMLLYDKEKTAKTFLHPPSEKTEEDDDDGGYMKIKQMITESGTGGSLGLQGGQKAYFFGRITETEDGPNVVSIDTSELAPSQAW
jgi:hypothetical protein